MGTRHAGGGQHALAAHFAKQERLETQHEPVQRVWRIVEKRSNTAKEQGVAWRQIDGLLVRCGRRRKGARSPRLSQGTIGGEKVRRCDGWARFGQRSGSSSRRCCRHAMPPLVAIRRVELIRECAKLESLLHKLMACMLVWEDVL